jgi:hypothetical protein
MTKTHPAFWGAGWAAIAVGAALLLFGLTSASEVARVAGGYGLMLIGAGLYLIAGLKIRERLVDRAEARRVRRVALSRLPARPAGPAFGEQAPAAAATVETAR